MRRFHCTCAVLLVLATSVLAQAPTSETHGFIIFVRGAAIGREDVTVQRSADGLTVSGRSRVAPPLDTVTQNAEIRYNVDGMPLSLALEGTVQGRPFTIKASFKGNEALAEVTQDDRRMVETQKITPKTIVLPNLFFGSYEAMASRLAGVMAGAELPAYIAPQLEVPARVRAIYNESIQTGAHVFQVRRYELAVANPGGDMLMHVTADGAGRLIRLTVPAQSLDVVREDVAAANARTSTFANPGDESVTIPSIGFNLAGTLTRPKGASTARFPAVVLVSGQNATDRDSLIAGVPIMAEIAGALADAGIASIRFDKRGYGQSGGRAEAATLTDFSDDARTVVKYLADRKFVDPRRIAILGHDEGAWIALLTAGREDKVKAVVSIAGAASTGSELVLELQQHQLDQMKLPPEERRAKVDLQKQINDAVLTGKGWEQIPREFRRVDSPWFQSFLKFDPSRALKDVDQPLLIVNGELDREVPVSHADRLAAIARKVSDSKSVDVVAVRGVNHLLIPATSGETSEYGALTDRHVSEDVANTIINWLSKTLTAK